MSEGYKRPHPKNKNQRKRYYPGYKKKKYYNQNKDENPYGSINFKKISIVIPLLNEEESLRTLVAEIDKSLTVLKSTYEILFIDDGSKDNSMSVIRELRRKNNRIKYVSFRKNYGKAAALQVGFKEATGDVVVTMDADLQDDPAEIPSMLKKLNEGWDLVSGWKKKRYDPFIKKHTSKFFNFTTRLMSGITIHDANCGLKAYRAEVVKSIKIYGELHRYIPVLAHFKGFTVTEIPVRHHPRRYGKTKYGISRFFKGYIDLVSVTFTSRYVKRPLHFFGFVGSISFLAGLLINAYLTYEWMFEQISLSRRPLLFLGMLLMIVGIQLFSVGLIGDIIVYNKYNSDEYSIKDSKL